MVCCSCLQAVLLVAVVASVRSHTVPSVHQSVVCLVDDDSPDNLQDELYLHCTGASVININTLTHGYHEQAADTRTCAFQRNAECVAEDAKSLQGVLKTCMGGRRCTVPVERIFLNPCGRMSNYVQVEYECVPDTSVDICGEMLQGRQVSRLSGYIKTPDYPDLYPPDISCSCNLTALDSEAHITLTLLDIQLEESVNKDCQWDWLEYTTPIHGWGRGVKMCQRHLVEANNTFTGNKTILLNFRADNKVEDRGFWLKYEGRNLGGEEVEVLLQCKNTQPHIIRKTAACLKDNENEELFLDCEQVGVINVLSAQYGRRSSGSDHSHCDYQLAPECSVSMTTDPLVLRRCMGQVTCVIPIRPQPLPQCANTGPSGDFFQVKYQCIPEAYEADNTVDVCGDSLDGRTTYRHSGYVESPGYPLNYPPSLQCQCFLSTEADASLQLRLLDARLATDTVSGACDADWLSVTLSHAAAWRSGRRFCDRRDVISDAPAQAAASADFGEAAPLIDVGSSEVRLDFNSDEGVEDRGFWLQYYAIRKDGLRVGVQIQCSQRHARLDNPSGDLTSDNGDSSRPLAPHSNTGLVIGLTLIGVFIFAIILLLIILKYKKVIGDKSAIRKGKMSSAEASTPLDKGHTTFRKYSTLEEPNTQQNGLKSEARPNSSDTHRNYAEPLPDYDVTLSTSGSHLPSAYVNPAFDGTLEPASFHNAAC